MDIVLLTWVARFGTSMRKVVLPHDADEEDQMGFGSRSGSCGGRSSAGNVWKNLFRIWTVSFVFSFSLRSRGRFCMVFGAL